jgi:O-acetylserine/cysteine efflux transporter
MTNNRRLVFPALLAAGVLWGTTVPLSKVALGWLPPGWLAFARFALAAAVLLVASRSRLRRAASPAILVTGAIGYGGSVLLQNLGIERTSVTHAALLIGATPVLVALIAAVLRHSVARPLAWSGFALSLAGVGLIAGGRGSGSSLGGDALVLAAQLISAGFTVSQARLLRGRDPIAVTGLQLAAAAFAVLPIALVTEHHAAGPGTVTALLATIGLVVAGTVLPTSLFAFGQSRVSADVAGAFLNLEPLVGAIMGIVLFAEPAGPVQIAGGTAITVGISLSSFQVVRGERRRASAASPATATTATQRTASSPRTARAATSTAGADILVMPGARPDAEGSVSGRAPAASLRPPGEAPSVVKRTRLPQPWAVGGERLRRPGVGPSGQPARPASRSRRERASERRADQRSRRQKLASRRQKSANPRRAAGRTSAGKARAR